MAEDSGSKSKLRRTAGIMLLIIGIPNTLAGIALFVGGIIGVVMITIVVVSMLFTNPSSDSAFAGLCWIFIIILFIILLILLLIGVIVVAFLSLGFVAQVIAGYLALKGKRFGWTLALSIFGTVIAFMTPFCLAITFLSTHEQYPWLLIPGLLEVVFACVSLVASVIGGAFQVELRAPKAEGPEGAKDKDASE